MTGAADPGIGDALDVALRVAAALEGLGCAYFIGGSIASSLQGEPRATNDIDIVVTLQPRQVRAFADALGPDFEVDVDMLRDALARGSCANIFYLPLVTKVDLFALGPSRFDESEFARRQPIAIRASGETLYIKAPEDTVLRKLLWFQAGGEVSEKQWRDIIEVLRISGPQMDRAYLRHWAQVLRIPHLLDRAESEAARD